jgi:hypothetical protein
VFGAFASQPIQPGRRNQYNAGLEQSIGKFLSSMLIISGSSLMMLLILARS